MKRKMGLFDAEMDNDGNVKSGLGWWLILGFYFVIILGGFGFVMFQGLTR